MATQTFTRDDVKYQIVVTAHDGTYGATWKCLDCGDGGGQTPGDYANAGGAFDAARARLFTEHHVRAHGGTAAACRKR
jgi:hypothetical protein